MSNPITFGELEFNLVADMDDAVGKPDSEEPFRILIMGDFSGRANRGVASSGTTLKNQRPILIDRDNVDAMMSKLEVGLTLPILGKTASPVNIRFSELEDFHPDHLYERLAVFQALKDTRKRVLAPATFAAVADEITGASTVSESSAPPKTPEHRTTEKPQPVSANLLDQIIAQTPGEAPSKTDSPPPPSEWKSFLQDIVRPHLISDPHPRQVEMASAVNAATGELMRVILHDPDFMALEASWKGLHFLLSRLETDALLKVYLLDISKEELAMDLCGVEDLRSTGLYRILVEQSLETLGADPWAVLVGNYYFEQRMDDIEFLGQIAKVARAARAPFIAAASNRMLCHSSLAKTPDPDDWKVATTSEAAQAWQSLRKLSEAAYIGLALPRFLLRLPYGTDTDPVETFDFEEMASAFDHNICLWGNAGFACALLIGQAFSLSGWQLRPGDSLDIDNLPLYLYKDGADRKLLPCAEALLTQRSAEMILDKGLMPLLSFLNQDAVRLARVQAIATPLTRLAGRWEA